jgi:DNA-binding NarL/FixJ family response regulator
MCGQFYILLADCVRWAIIGLSPQAKKEGVPVSTSRTLVVVENESLLRDLIARSLEAVGFDVTTAANASDAKRACKAVDPDACIVDIELGPGPDGFDFAEYLSREAPDVGVVFLTNLPDPRFAQRDSKSVKQSQAYLRKSQLVDSKELVDAVNAVLKEEDVSQYRHDQAAGRPLADLSKRQLVVLQLMAEGLSNSQIAEARGTTVRAVEGMISRIFQALDIDAQGSGNARIAASKAYLGAVGAVASDQ